MGKGLRKNRLTEVLITMAGLGKRFRDAGYNCPKYLIKAHGRTLFTWSMLSLRSFIQSGANFTFVVRRADTASSFIYTEAEKLGIVSVKIVEIDALTDGQATTALLGGKVIKSQDQPFLVYNIDTFVHPDALPASAVCGEGWVPCFPGMGNSWSFASIAADSRIIDLQEKVRISPHATIGLYWFSSYLLYKQLYEVYYNYTTKLVKGERYIAPMYCHMIAAGQDVFAHEIPYDAVIPMGTPAEVDAFLLQEPPDL